MIGMSGLDEENNFSVKPEENEPSDLAVYGVADVRSAMAVRNKLAAEQQARYDAQAKEIMARRAGPSFSERMLELSAALAQPTSRRGFGGVLANVSPVLAAQERAKREGMDTRREALEALEDKRLAQQMGLANQDVNTQVALARINAAANKPVDPFKGAVYDPNTMRWVPRPGTAGAPPVLTPEQVAELSKDPKNRGMKFYTTDGRPMEIK
jgi:hypothetical protein